uniref:RRM domain-containing protein n=1 Tax=Schistosoma mansoni TaxID=6183 RepID=A0A5K4F9N5_SCHMA
MATVTCSNTSGICSDLNEMNGDPHRIWLGCLPKRITEFSVLQLAKQFGELSDFHFPVHKTGDMQGSTVGYCFLTYRSVDDAKKAWKVLNGLDFHGHTLVARPARPTRDELTVAQRSYDEASRFRIMEEAIQREAQLSAMMAICDSTSVLSNSIEDPFSGTISDEQISTPKISSYAKYLSASSSHVHIPDLYGKRDLSQNSQTSSKINSHNLTLGTSSCSINHRRSKHQIETKTAIHRIERALKNLEKTPIGGVASLKPITNGHNNPYSDILILKSANPVKCDKNNRIHFSTSSPSVSCSMRRTIRKTRDNNTTKLHALPHHHRCTESNDQLICKRDFIAHPI